VHRVRGLRDGGALAVRRERLEIPRVMLGQSHGSGLQRNSSGQSRASSLLGELQGTVRHGLHRPIALQSDNHAWCVVCSNSFAIHKNLQEVSKTYGMVKLKTCFGLNQCDFNDGNLAACTGKQHSLTSQQLYQNDKFFIKTTF